MEIELLNIYDTISLRVLSCAYRSSSFEYPCLSMAFNSWKANYSLCSICSCVPTLSPVPNCIVTGETIKCEGDSSVSLLDAAARTFCLFKSHFHLFCLQCPEVVANRKLCFHCWKVVDKITSGPCCLQCTVWQICWLGKIYFQLSPAGR